MLNPASKPNTYDVYKTTSRSTFKTVIRLHKAIQKSSEKRIADISFSDVRKYSSFFIPLTPANNQLVVTPAAQSAQKPNATAPYRLSSLE